MSRSSKIRSTGALFGILGTAVALAIFAGAIPDNPYLRFQLLKDTFHAPVPWMYERIHFDRTPIDVVIVGPSRTWLGVSSTRMEENLSRSGLPSGVVNFSMPQEGRNANYVIIKELFKAERRPKLIVIGVVDKPQRAGHPAFKYISDTEDLVRAVYPININYFSDIAYLPFRQLKLAAMSELPDAFNVTTRFDSASYVGSNYDATVSSRFVPDRFTDHGIVARAKLLSDATQWKRDLTYSLLPDYARDIEFGAENVYIREIASLAKSRGAKVAFLYIPYFSGPSSTLEDSFYAQFGPVFNADFVTDRDQLFLDYAHLNHAGARLLTDWLSDRIAPLLR